MRLYLFDHQQILFGIVFEAMLIIAVILLLDHGHTQQVLRPNVTNHVRAHLGRVRTLGSSANTHNLIPVALIRLLARVSTTMTHQIRSLLEHTATVGFLAYVQWRVFSVAVLLHLNRIRSHKVTVPIRARKDAIQVVVPQMVSKTTMSGKRTATFDAWPGFN